MTSSLVGSEMCIRDSARGPDALPACVPEERGGDAARLQTKRGRHLKSAAVSYTHLTLPTICSV
eukprot:6600490-Prorocentrum_lima.AAC.1